MALYSNWIFPFHIWSLMNGCSCTRKVKKLSSKYVNKFVNTYHRNHNCTLTIHIPPIIEKVRQRIFRFFGEKKCHFSRDWKKCANSLQTLRTRFYIIRTRYRNNLPVRMQSVYIDRDIGNDLGLASISVHRIGRFVQSQSPRYSVVGVCARFI